MVGCDSEAGRRPTVGVLHFPTAAVASSDGRFLYVANSNFNLEFSGALVHAFDLDKIRAAATNAQANPNDPSAAFDRDESKYVVADGNGTTPRGAAVRVGSYVTAMQIAPDGNRLYVASRASGCISWMDRGADGMLECGQSSAGGACDENASAVQHCVGASRTGRRDLLLPPNPTSIDVFDRNGARYITVTHHEESRSRVSLLVQASANDTPIVAHYANEFSARLWTQLRLPTAEPHWLVFSRDDPTMGHVRLFEDGASSFVFRAPTTFPSTVSGSLGVIHVALDPCNPNRAYAAARARRTSGSGVGDALLAIDVSNPDDPRVVETLSMPIGPTRVVPVRRGATCADGVDLYTVLYDSRKLYVVDAQSWREVAQIRTQVGPTDFVVDPGLGAAGHNFFYVINFSSMCIEVVDATTRRVVFTIGDPIRPRELS
jgi:DNA-binding beta-propeller fold protein YncE